MKFARVVERWATPIGEGYGATWQGHVTVDCKKCGLAPGWWESWEEAFGDWDPEEVAS